MLCDQGQEPTLDDSTFRVLHSGWLQPYSKSPETTLIYSTDTWPSFLATTATVAPATETATATTTPAVLRFENFEAIFLHIFTTDRTDR